MGRSALEVADIFRIHGPAWRQAQRAHLSREIMKARHGSVRIGDDPGGAAVLTLTFRPLP